MKQGETRFRLLYTSNYVLDEVFTLLRSRLSLSTAVKLGEDLKKSKILRTLQINLQIQEEAWRIFEKYQVKDFSFTDCTSFAAMEQGSISTAFTFDTHFQQYGFHTVP